MEKLPGEESMSGVWSLYQASIAIRTGTLPGSTSAGGCQQRRALPGLLALVCLLILGWPAAGHAQTVADDKTALEALYDATGGMTAWTTKTNWKSTEPLGTWHGVDTNSSGRVTRLDLRENGLIGQLPDELGDLTALEELRLTDNALGGTIPAALGNLTNLRELYCDNCGFTGAIPAALGDLSNLTELSFQSNVFTGTIPAALGGLTKLEELRLTGSQLTGPIPAALGNLTKLKNLTLLSNRLNGSIPGWLGSFSELTSLNLSHNKDTADDPPQYVGFTGPIPPALGDLDNLENLDLKSNSLTGPIPPALGDLDNLKNLELQDNSLTGPIPPALGGLANLTQLDLSLNELTGPIPPTWGGPTHPLGNLEFLHLLENQLSGDIPPTLGNLDSLKQLWLHKNALTGPIPPTWGGPTHPLANLVYLWLFDNELTGTIPPTLGGLANLQQLALSGNQLSGPIPPELSDLTNLAYLYLHRNQLTGDIPPELGKLDNLGRLWLHYNKDLTGPIPGSWGTSTHPFGSLQFFLLFDTNWTGSIPQSVQDLPLTWLWTNRRPQAPTGLTLRHALEPGEPYTYTVPAFTDREGDKLTYHATLEDGSPLPNWLTFEENNDREFSVTLSAEVGSVSVKLSVTDEDATTIPATIDEDNPFCWSGVRDSSLAAETSTGGKLPVCETVTLAFTMATEVPHDWSLIPSGLSIGDQFRLLFVSSTTRNAESSDIADYDAHVQSAAVAGHADIRAYSAQFKALASTSSVDARDHTKTTGTGVPIYYLDGAKVADDYGDFYDGRWATNQPRTEAGNVSSGGVWTGSDSAGKETSSNLGPLGLGATNSSNSSSIGNPASNGRELEGHSAFWQGSARSLYGLSDVFQVGKPPEVTLVSNTDSYWQPGGPISQDYLIRTQAFTTGSHAAGYAINSIGLDFNIIYDNANPEDELTATLNTGDGPLPGTVLCTLDSPEIYTGDFNTYQASTCPPLEPNTTYRFVLSWQDSGNTLRNRTIVVNRTPSPDEDAGGAAGWTIANSRHLYFLSPTTGNKDWKTDTGFSLVLKIKGFEMPSRGTPGRFAPGSPTNPKVSGRNAGELDMGWTPPASDGGAKINGYTVLYQPTGGPPNGGDAGQDPFSTRSRGVDDTRSVGPPSTPQGGTVDTTGTSVVITGLTDGVEYTVRVIAHNDVGASPPSDPVTGTPGPDGPVPGVVLTGIAVTSSPANGTAYAAGERIEATVTFAAPIEVDISDGTPTVALMVGGAVRTAVLDQVSGTASLVFAYTVTAADTVNGDIAPGAVSIGVGGLQLNGAVIQAAASPPPAVATPLTASFGGVPTEHDGSAAFTFRLQFSEPVGVGYATLRDQSLAASGGTVTRAKRVDGRNDLWEIEVEPAGAAGITVTLTGGRACGTTGAVCTRGADPRPLSNSPSATIPGPPDVPLTASFSGVPTEHDGSAAFTFRLQFSEAVGVGYKTLRDAALSAAGGTVTRAKRVNGSNALWEIEVEPSGGAGVTVTLAGGRACGTTGAVCTRGDDQRPLTNSPSVTIPGPQTPRELTGTDNDDTLSGRDGDDTLSGGLGADTLVGGDGDDILVGDDGDTSVTDGREGADVLEGEGGDDELYGDAGNDELYGGDDDDLLHGDAGDDELYGDDEDSGAASGDDELYGGIGDDALYGDGGDDALDGGAGDDELEGGTGADTLTGGPGADTFVFAAGHGTDTITDFSPEESDLIDVSAFTDITAYADLSLTDHESDTVLDLGSHGGGTVRLQGVSAADLEAGDFGLPQ